MSDERSVASEEDYCGDLEHQPELIHELGPLTKYVFGEQGPGEEGVLGELGGDVASLAAAARGLGFE